MDNNNDEIRLDREQDNERKSDFPLQDNTVKTTQSPKDVGYQENENLNDADTKPGQGDPANEPNTQGIP